MKKILLSWSGGKDSAWALHVLRLGGEYEVGGLVTTVNERFRRVAIHGFREELLVRQAEAVGFPLWVVDLPFPCTNAEYEARMGEVYGRAVREGFAGVAFGDLYLEDVRAYRVRTLAGTGLEAVFPVWGVPTGELAAAMLGAGVRARLTCVDPRRVPGEWAGREWDRGWWRRLGGWRGWIVVGRMGSSTRSAGRGLCLLGRCRWRRGRGWSGMGFGLRKWWGHRLTDGVRRSVSQQSK